jgi:large subunit ribosomal protein LX
MSEFTVTGEYRTRTGPREFEITIESENENVAREHAFATLGSRHGLKRNEIELEEVAR